MDNRVYNQAGDTEGNVYVESSSSKPNDRKKYNVYKYHVGISLDAFMIRCIVLITIFTLIIVDIATTRNIPRCSHRNTTVHKPTKFNPWIADAVVSSDQELRNRAWKDGEVDKSILKQYKLVPGMIPMSDYQELMEVARDRSYSRMFKSSFHLEAARLVDRTVKPTCIAAWSEIHAHSSRFAPAPGPPHLSPVPCLFSLYCPHLASDSTYDTDVTRDAILTPTPYESYTLNDLHDVDGKSLLSNKLSNIHDTPSLHGRSLLTCTYKVGLNTIIKSTCKGKQSASVARRRFSDTTLWITDTGEKLDIPHIEFPGLTYHYDVLDYMIPSTISIVKARGMNIFTDSGPGQTYQADSYGKCSSEYLRPEEESQVDIYILHLATLASADNMQYNRESDMSEYCIHKGYPFDTHNEDVMYNDMSVWGINIPFEPYASSLDLYKLEILNVSNNAISTSDDSMIHPVINDDGSNRRYVCVPVPDVLNMYPCDQDSIRCSPEDIRRFNELMQSNSTRITPILEYIKQMEVVEAYIQQRYGITINDFRNMLDAIRDHNTSAEDFDHMFRFIKGIKLMLNDIDVDTLGYDVDKMLETLKEEIIIPSDDINIDQIVKYDRIPECFRANRTVRECKLTSIVDKSKPIYNDIMTDTYNKVLASTTSVRVIYNAISIAASAVVFICYMIPTTLAIRPTKKDNIINIARIAVPVTVSITILMIIIFMNTGAQFMDNIMGGVSIYYSYEPSGMCIHDISLSDNERSCMNICTDISTVLYEDTVKRCDSVLRLCNATGDECSKCRTLYNRNQHCAVSCVSEIVDVEGDVYDTVMTITKMVGFPVWDFMLVLSILAMDVLLPESWVIGADSNSKSHSISLLHSTYLKLLSGRVVPLSILLAARTFMVAAYLGTTFNIALILSMCAPFLGVAMIYIGKMVFTYSIKMELYKEN